MANTKIIATLGPASKDQGLIRDLILAGVDVFRVNMSHGSYDLVKEIIGNVRGVSCDMKVNIPVFMDLRGPKIRIGIMENDEAMLKKGVSAQLMLIPKLRVMLQFSVLITNIFSLMWIKGMLFCLMTGRSFLKWNRLI